MDVTKRAPAKPQMIQSGEAIMIDTKEEVEAANSVPNKVMYEEVNVQ